VCIGIQHVGHSYSKWQGHYNTSSCSGLYKNESRFMQCDNMPLLLGLWVCSLQRSGAGVEMISSQILSSSCAMTGGGAHCGLDKWPWQTGVCASGLLDVTCICRWWCVVRGQLLARHGGVTAFLFRGQPFVCFLPQTTEKRYLKDMSPVEAPSVNLTTLVLLRRHWNMDLFCIFLYDGHVPTK